MASKQDPAVLLAKPAKDPTAPTERETLVGHLNDVFSVGAAIADIIGLRVLDSLGLGSPFSEKLRRAMGLATFLHDVGKANAHFQRALDPKNNLPQALRHEWLSVWLTLRLPDLDHFLFAGCSEEVKNAVLFSVLGHHLKFGEGAALKVQPGSGDVSVTVFTDHPDFASILQSLSVSLRHDGNPPVLSRIQVDLLDRPLPELRSWLPEMSDWYQKSSRETRVFVALVKALLISADVAGSAVPRAGIDEVEWTERVLKRTCLAEDLDAIASTSLNGRPTRRFQGRVADSSGQVTFTKAGCGSGKTTAAYLWASRRAAGRKVFFCYPTTGTATEGFREYVLPAEMRAETALLHSRAECDVESIIGAADDVFEQQASLESLTSWDVPLIICTVDQVLALIQNGRKSLFSFPSIGNGAFVFDEIHQHDDRLFGALLTFLDTFRDSPILLMTASLPKYRLEAIKGVLAKRRAALEIVEGPADLEAIPRYLMSQPIELTPWEQIFEVLKDGGNILWVANTVDRCVGFIKESEQRGLSPLPYHSRYRYIDRIEKHNAVIEAFKNKRGILAITTQVCEVSLDISADLLVTDLAPIPSLIQRLGRLNRRVTPETPGEPKSAVLLAPESERPYERQDLELARGWVGKVGERPVSQADLASAFEDMTETGVFPTASAWLDGGPFSPRRTLREADSTIPVVRSEDEAFYLDRVGKPVTKGITRYAIPMLLGPVADEIARWKRLSYVFVAPPGRIDYSDKWGARWLTK